MSTVETQLTKINSAVGFVERELVPLKSSVNCVEGLFHSFKEEFETRVKRVEKHVYSLRKDTEIIRFPPEATTQDVQEKKRSEDKDSPSEDSKEE